MVSFHNDVLSLPDPKVKEAEITSLVPNSLLPNVSSQRNPHSALPLLDTNEKLYRFVAEQHYFQKEFKNIFVDFTA